MGELKIKLEWGASWKQDNCYHCTLFIEKDYFNHPRFGEYLLEQFGVDFGGWKYDKHIHGVEVWFKNKQDMLTFKILSQTQLNSL
jgi:thioredoxin-related protein